MNAVLNRMSVFYRALLGGAVVFVTLAAPGGAQPRHRPPASYVQPTPPDAAEGAAILERSRSFSLGGPYYLEFTLRVLPRVGEERSVPGRWLGSRNVTGPVTRLELERSASAGEALLVQAGFVPRVWRGTVGESLALIDGAATFEPFAGTNITPADLATPFMYWTDHVYEGLARFRGRPTHVFMLYPPARQAGDYPSVGGVRVFIDTAYGAISQAQWIDDAGAVLKTITVLGLKRIDERWIVKSFEVRDEITRDKTRFNVTGALLDLEVSDAIFLPNSPVGITEVTKTVGAVTPVR